MKVLFEVDCRVQKLTLEGSLQSRLPSRHRGRLQPGDAAAGILNVLNTANFSAQDAERTGRHVVS